MIKLEASEFSTSYCAPIPIEKGCLHETQLTPGKSISSESNEQVIDKANTINEMESSSLSTEEQSQPKKPKENKQMKKTEKKTVRTKRLKAAEVIDKSYVANLRRRVGVTRTGTPVLEDHLNEETDKAERMRTR